MGLLHALPHASVPPDAVTIFGIAATRTPNGHEKRSRGAVTVVTGQRNRLKRVRVHGVSATHISATLDAHDIR